MPKNPKTTLPIKLINYSYSTKIIRGCMEKYSLLTKLAKCTFNIALKLTFSASLSFFVFWLHFRPPRHCLMPFFERQFCHLGEKLSLKKMRSRTRRILRKKADCKQFIPTNVCWTERQIPFPLFAIISWRSHADYWRPIGTVEVKVLTSQTLTYKLCRVWYVTKDFCSRRESRS